MKWEYKTLFDVSSIELTQLGKDGWELVSVIWMGGNYGKAGAYLKRKLPTQPQDK